MFCAVSEYANEGDLTQLIKKQESALVPWSTFEISEYFMQVVSGMAFLHKHKIIHRDIKPANILVHLPPGSKDKTANLTQEERKIKLKSATEKEPVVVVFADEKGYPTSGKVISHEKKGLIGRDRDVVFIVVVGDKTFEKKIDDLTMIIPAARVLKIADFGLAKEEKEVRANKNARKTKCGTEVYMSPEMLDRGGYSFETDLWAMGCVLYELW